VQGLDQPNFLIETSGSAVSAAESVMQITSSLHYSGKI